MKQLLDQPTYLRAQWLLGAARVWGVDPVEQLHTSGLLLTPDRERAIKIQAMEFLLAEISGWRPAEFIRRTDKTGTGSTAADIHRNICEFVQDHIDAAREGG